MKKAELLYGLVKITRGPHKGRIGYCDDDHDGTYAVVYFGDMLKGSGNYFIPFNYMTSANTDDILQRLSEISNALFRKASKLRKAEKASLLLEHSLIEKEFYERLLHARLTTGGRKSVFISHSSKDKQFARKIAIDVAKAGHSPWLDEWKIKVGESIPVEISRGIESCDALIVVLSQSAVISKWVENEWQAKYWDEVKERQVKVLPALLSHCEIPTLLKTKKYADFTKEYDKGLTELLIALSSNR